MLLVCRLPPWLRSPFAFPQRVFYRRNGLETRAGLETIPETPVLDGVRSSSSAQTEARQEHQSVMAWWRWYWSSSSAPTAASDETVLLLGLEGTSLRRQSNLRAPRSVHACALVPLGWARRCWMTTLRQPGKSIVEVVGETGVRNPAQPSGRLLRWSKGRVTVLTKPRQPVRPGAPLARGGRRSRPRNPRR